ncbi:hypothetical protein GOP47_0010855 [Adiantum capillus-veneris]|uniref:Uncharacterized protein n=1 Tax=Adiantum capillus-veneris TaxID=13818 RepID=A0A9D4UW19_ADICA|nr:hypothetical protein GOP47_0010855 [Adiantum capillus-veneris]
MPGLRSSITDLEETQAATVERAKCNPPINQCQSGSRQQSREDAWLSPHKKAMPLPSSVPKVSSPSQEKAKCDIQNLCNITHQYPTAQAFGEPSPLSEINFETASTTPSELAYTWSPIDHSKKERRATALGAKNKGEGMVALTIRGWRCRVLLPKEHPAPRASPSQMASLPAPPNEPLPCRRSSRASPPICTSKAAYA